MRNFVNAFMIEASLLGLLCIAAPAAAQDAVGLSGPVSGANELPFARRSNELTAMGMMLQFRGQKLQGKRCFETGCLFIINQTTDYDAVGLYLDVGSPDPADAPVWGPNLFRNSKLRPQLARWTYKAGDASMCALAARVVLRHRKTGEEVISDGVVSLCKSPKVDSALRINVTMPKVTIEEPGAH
ncbi:hypothetical protein MZO42_14700 [Sphingomonas psychrotolerans]|uniref:DUF2147 domain-containing protein n=1 Tax=Sphingomonas psychrotolerans TaxID=1327635 RepID=A0ABU3N5Z7_9SPHN|nr:hypothetical protein [Sphingomonas psychrotolerans]MDT8759949.1 hypothetical protein [Sphingomonas psychrotolerans]